MLKYLSSKIRELKIHTSVILVFIVMFITYLIINPKVFLNYNIYSSFMSTIPFLGIMALAITPIVILGEIDMSFPSVLAVSACVFSNVFVNTGYIWIAIVLGLLTGLFAGFINSILIVRFGIPSMVATLGTMFFWRGIVNVLGEGRGISLVNAKDTILYNLFVGRLGNVVPAQAIWFLVIGIGFFLAIKYFRFSTHVLFSTNTKKDSNKNGKNIKLIKTIVFSQMSFFAAFSGILLSLEVRSFWPSQGRGYLLPTLAAVFIGGASVFGGKGAVLGSFFGAIIIGSLDAGIVAIGLSPFLLQVVYGIVIIVCILLYNKDFNFKTIIENIMDNTTDNIFFKDRKSRFVLINKAYAKWLGLNDSSQAVGKKADDFFNSKIADRIKKEEEEILNTGKFLSIEIEEKIPGENKNAWILLKKYPFYNDKGELIGTFGITRDITEKNISTEREKEMQQKIILEREEANKQKTQFYINLAHEIKTPLTLIQNYLEKYINKKGIDKDLGVVKQNIDKLIRDIVNYMDAEKLTKDQIFYNHDLIINFSDLLKSKIVLFKSFAKNKKIKLTNCIENNIIIKADPYAIDRIINNLIDNSIKYTNDNGTIEVNLKLDDDLIILEVKDSGIGITEEQQKYIFEAFHQLSHQKRNIQGIGMGLYIVKKIVDSLNGTLLVDSNTNRGTTFRISLKKYNLKENDLIQGKVNVSQPIKKEYLTGELKEEEIIAGKPNIFLVDDNLEMIAFLQTSLKDKYNVFFAFNGKQALEKLKLIPIPDLIISDIMMDELDGHEFFKMLSLNIEFRLIPFIFLTARNTIDEKLKGLLEGAIDYIYKPFLIDEIKIKIENIIKNKNEQQERNIRHIGKKIEEFLKINLNNESEEYIKFNEICLKFIISPREKQVLELIIKGFLNKEISHNLKISLSTVDFHIHNIYKKLNVQNKIELMNKIRV